MTLIQALVWNTRGPLSDVKRKDTSRLCLQGLNIEAEEEVGQYHSSEEHFVMK